MGNEMVHSTMYIMFNVLMFIWIWDRRFEEAIVYIPVYIYAPVYLIPPTHTCISVRDFEMCGCID